MDTSKLSRYDWVVVAGMILMFIALFLTWYRVGDPRSRCCTRSRGGLGVSGNATSPGVSVNGWHYSSAVIAWLLTARSRRPGRRCQGAARAPQVPAPAAGRPHGDGLGVVAFVLVLFRLICVPAPQRLRPRRPASSSRCSRPSAVAVGGFLKNAETS